MMMKVVSVACCLLPAFSCLLSVVVRLLSDLFCLHSMTRIMMMEMQRPIQATTTPAPNSQFMTLK
jgi:hypothetical protein